MIYLKYLLFHKKISEIHLWQFTNNEQDVQYLNSISNIHKTNGYFMDYIKIYPEIKNNSFYININTKKLLLQEIQEGEYNSENMSPNKLNSSFTQKLTDSLKENVFKMRNPKAKIVNKDKEINKALKEIKQSKKLMELGLDPNTANMVYFIHHNNEGDPEFAFDTIERDFRGSRLM